MTSVGMMLAALAFVAGSAGSYALFTDGTLSAYDMTDRQRLDEPEQFMTGLLLYSAAYAGVATAMTAAIYMIVTACQSIAGMNHGLKKAHWNEE